MSQVPPSPVPPQPARAPYPLDYGPPAPARLGRKLFGWIVFIGVAVTLLIVLTGNRRTSTNVALSEFADQLDAGNVASVTIDGETLRGDFAKPIAIRGPVRVSNFRTEVPSGSQSWEVARWLLEKRSRGGTTVLVENSGSYLTSLVVPLIPWLILFLFVWFFILRNLRKAAATAGKPTPVVIVNPEATR